MATGINTQLDGERAPAGLRAVAAAAMLAFVMIAQGSRAVAQVAPPAPLPVDTAATALGLTPDVVKSTYMFPDSPAAGDGATVAVVTAYDAPTIEADLDVFSGEFGLPPCTSANGCFKKVTAFGSSLYPPSDVSWAFETALDVEWVHAIAPGASVLLVQANSNEWADLLNAVDYASHHAGYVSMSWAAPEFASESAFDSHFRQPGVSYFAGSGDARAVSYPAASPYVVAVGGTRLTDIGTVDFKETVWVGSGRGCSAYEPAPPEQQIASGQQGCPGQRVTPDLSLVASPGLAVYSSQAYDGAGGWLAMGGTSASTAVVAARAAATGQVIDGKRVYSEDLTFRQPAFSGPAAAAAGFAPAPGRGSWIGVTP